MHRIRAITLDLDDTLWAIEPVIQKAEQRLWQWLTEHYPRIPLEFSGEDFLQIRQSVVEQNRDRSHDFRFLRKRVLATVAVHAGYSEDLVEPAFEVFDQARNEVELYVDVLPNLEFLSRRFVLVALTNGNADLATIGIKHLFRDVITAADTGVAKPARPIFDRAVAKTGYSAAEVLHVGDHPEADVGGAQAAGLRTAWINRNEDEWPDHLSSPDAVVTDILQLRELLQSAIRPPSSAD